MLRRRVASMSLAAGAATLMTVIGAAASHANGIGVPGGGRPDRQVGASMDPLVFPATPDPLGVCPFPVTVRDVELAVTEKHYPDGSTKGAGRHVVQITNDTTGASVVRDISGPGRTYTDAAGVFHYILTGASLTWVLAGKDTTGSVPVGLYIRHGNVDYDGDLNLLSYTGTAENLCTTLA